MYIPIEAAPGRSRHAIGNVPLARGFARTFLALLLILPCLVSIDAHAQTEEAGPLRVAGGSIAREWNELLLFAIRRDFARPTVHARNLFHISAAMYDAWAAFDEDVSPYFLGRVQANEQRCELDTATRSRFTGVADADLRQQQRETAISYAAYRLIRRRFADSPGVNELRARSDALFDAQGLDRSIVSTAITASPTPEILGNYIAECVTAYGLLDGANEGLDYANRFYEPLNAPLDPVFPGNPNLSDPNRWQPLQLDVFVDQSGNATDTPFFLGAEWADVVPFALTDADLSDVMRGSTRLPVYLDPGPPALLADDPEGNADYLNGHALVALWSAHLDPSDGVMWDISPRNSGNAELPDNDDLLAFYNRLEGGTAGDRGHALNPATGEPYAPNLVPRGDYTRVLAEFWADGPDSETPPGHWFRIYNEAVVAHPDFSPRFGGNGDALDPLEFDIKAYFLLGGAMHDSAIAAWSAKGAYDYIRPISAIRYMSARGQSSDPEGRRFSVQGVPLVPGRIEIVESGDPLAGNGAINVGKIKVLAWRGPSFIRDPDADAAGVDWILMERWTTYQRPTFVTPPFAGYVSGHSTFSRAAAEILTLLTGDPYFPGGMAQFTARRNEFLVFEEGPSTDVVLQWATYRDASDQTSLSRIWGGIHPPVDDIPGRRMGIAVAERSWLRARTFFDGTAPESDVPITDADPAPETDGDNPLGVARSSGGGCSLAHSYTRQDPVIPALLLCGLLLASLSSRRRRA